MSCKFLYCVICSKTWCSNSLLFITKVLSMSFLSGNINVLLDGGPEHWIYMRLLFSFHKKYCDDVFLSFLSENWVRGELSHQVLNVIIIIYKGDQFIIFGFIIFIKCRSINDMHWGMYMLCLSILKFSPFIII